MEDGTRKHVDQKLAVLVPTTAYATLSHTLDTFCNSKVLLSFTTSHLHYRLLFTTITL